MDFKLFKTAVAKQFDRMRQHQLFRTEAGKDEMWDTYLDSFPEGTNPIYRERREYDCNCCKSFIRAIGNVVAIIDGKLESIWDIRVSEPAFQTVADALSALVKSKPVVDEFLHTERVAGVDRNYDMLKNTETKEWEHFFVNIPSQFVVPGTDLGTRLSKSRSTHDVMLRALTEITPQAIDSVLELILQNSLYRGEENKFAVIEFQKWKKDFDRLPSAQAKDHFVWSKIKGLPLSISGIRNTAIGSLLVDLSEDKDLEEAVKSFESKVAPTNYKRTTALVTPSMIAKAQEKVQELGLMSALERRYATLGDITINNVIFADRSAKKNMSGNVFEELAATVPEKVKNFDKVEEIPIEKFLTDVVPKADSIEVMVENRHQPNLVSLIAPVDPTAGQLFKWDNNFSWAYNGDVADSIRERVKNAGGSVTGDLCCRLAWFNHDDLDLHMREPGGTEIYFGHRFSLDTRGQLDVDMNAGCGETRTPVENIFYEKRDRMTEGFYTLFVNNYNKRESTNVGFEVEIDYLGTVQHFAYAKALKTGENVIVAKFKYTHANGVEILDSLPFSQASKTVWGLPTQAFRKVEALMLSPNHWDSNEGPGVGNKHYFFMLEGCKNDGKARGFFNEFLKNELDPHRKTFEMVGAKMKTDESDNQLSGLGFSSTKRDHLLVKVRGAFTRTVKVTF